MTPRARSCSLTCSVAIVSSFSPCLCLSSIMGSSVRAAAARARCSTSARCSSAARSENVGPQFQQIDGHVLPRDSQRSVHHKRSHARTLSLTGPGGRWRRASMSHGSSTCMGTAKSRHRSRSTARRRRYHSCTACTATRHTGGFRCGHQGGCRSGPMQAWARRLGNAWGTSRASQHDHWGGGGRGESHTLAPKLPDRRVSETRIWGTYPTLVAQPRHRSHNDQRHECHPDTLDSAAGELARPH